MDKLKELFSRPLVPLVLGFLVGLIIGLPVLGWGLFPVEWVDAAPSHLAESYKVDFLRMAVDSYAKNQDRIVALQRWEDIGGGEAEALLNVLQQEKRTDKEALQQFSQLVLGETSGEEVTEDLPWSTPEAGVSASEDTKESEGGMSLQTIGIALGALCMVTLVIGGFLLYMLYFRNKGRTTSSGTRSASSVPSAQPTSIGQPSVAAEEYLDDDHSLPVAQFMTTYTLGDDLYDDSFSIDAPSGEFLGECGVGISDTIGSGDPKKVDAFEVWLFDKNDIQTVTKVLMSEYAFNDPEVRQRLEAKGEPLLAEAGKHIVLETATLQLEARIVDINYGQGALPANSFLDRLTLELAVWPKTTF